VATVVLLVLAIVVFGRGLRGLAALSSWWFLNSVAFGLRCWRPTASWS
jgi:hypothetical protein